jgi:hypothetical protein
MSKPFPSNSKKGNNIESSKRSSGSTFYVWFDNNVVLLEDAKIGGEKKAYSIRESQGK